jgi:hypothetical protein
MCIQGSNTSRFLMTPVKLWNFTRALMEMSVVGGKPCGGGDDDCTDIFAWRINRRFSRGQLHPGVD